MKLTLITDQHAQTRLVNHCHLSQVADERLLAHLILVILERSSLLLNIPSYSTEIHRFSLLLTHTHRVNVFLCSLLSPSPPLLLQGFQLPPAETVQATPAPGGGPIPRAAGVCRDHDQRQQQRGDLHACGNEAATHAE